MIELNELAQIFILWVSVKVEENKILQAGNKDSLKNEIRLLPTIKNATDNK